MHVCECLELVHVVCLKLSLCYQKWEWKFTWKMKRHQLHLCMKLCSDSCLAAGGGTSKIFRVWGRNNWTYNLQCLAKWPSVLGILIAFDAMHDICCFSVLQVLWCPVVLQGSKNCDQYSHLNLQICDLYLPLLFWN